MHDRDFVDAAYEKKDLANLNKLTLIIPTYNRNYYLSRCLWYHAHFPFGQIIVADSSQEEKKAVNHLNVGKIRTIFGRNIQYLEYEPEVEIYGGDIYQKWGDAVQHATEKYSLICIDKSFLNIDSTLQKLEFLEKNLDYSSTQGIWYTMEQNNLSDYHCKYARDYYPPINPDHDDAIMRYIKSIGQKDSFNNQLFALFRTDLHKHIYQPIINGDIKDIRYGELAVSLLPLVNGKHKYFPEHMDLIRDISMVETSKGRDKSQSSNLRYPERQAYVTLGVLDEFYHGFEESILKQFHQVDITSLEREIRSATRKAYYDPIAHPGFDVKSLVLRKKWLREMWNKLPLKFKQIIFRRLDFYFDTEEIIENEFTKLIKEILIQFPQTEGDKSIM